MYSNSGQYGKGAYLRDSVSPPLHHPVPQHPIPPMRSPSNLEDTFASQNHKRGASNPYVPHQQQHQQQQQQSAGGQRQNNPAMSAFESVGATSDYGNAQPGQGQQQQQQQQQQQGGAFGQYSNLFMDPSAQIGINVGRNALSYGQDYVARHVSFFFFLVLWITV